MDALFCYHIVLMLVATVAFILLWIGFATPGWLVVTFQESEYRSEYTVSSLNRSLFYDILCPQELRDCKTCQAGDSSRDCVSDMGFVKYSQHYTWIELLTSDKEEWVAWRVIMVFVIVLCTVGFILVLCLVCCIFKTFVYRVVAITGFILWLIGSILAWIPVGMVTDMHLDIEDTVDDDVTHDASLHVPYSVVLVALGAFLALITAIMLLFLTGCCCNRNDKNSDAYSSESSKPVAAIPREQRYYGPQPYYVTEKPTFYYRDEPIQYTPSSERYVITPTDYKEGSGGWSPNRWYDNRVF